MVNNRLFRYLLVGGTSFIIEIAALYALHYLAHLSPTASVAISFWVGFFVAFVLQKTITFSNKDTKAKDIASQLIWYSLLVLFNYVFSLVMVHALSDTMPVIMVRTVTIIIVTAWNFVIYSKIFAPRLQHVKKVSKKSTAKNSFSSKYPKMSKLVNSKRFGYFYLATSLLLLIATTIYWALLGAKLQLNNADQLVNSFLFESVSTINDALLPASHSFLLKWPLFLLIGVKGATATLFIIATICLVVLTVSSLAYIVYRITKKPLLTGTIFLALASILLLVPTVPYSGALLPVNMAMLATRNIEYILYIIALIYVARAHKFISRAFVFGTLLLTLIIASDKLFLTLSIGGALVMIVPYLIKRQWSLVQTASRWLVASITATILAFGTLYALSALKVTHIVSQGGGLGPYGFVHTFRDLGRGIIFAFLGILTNFGANPGYSAQKLSDIPAKVFDNLTSPGGITYLLNFCLFIIGVSMVIQLIRATFAKKPAKAISVQTPIALSVMLLASTIVAIASFVFTVHYYPVDARYLNIALFAILIGAATYASKKSWQPLPLTFVGALITVGIVAGTFSILGSYRADITALASVNSRGDAVVQALQSHKVDYLLGDYWRVLPLKLHTNTNFTLAPLENCTQYRQVLSSTNWQPDLKKHSFAYLLSLDKSLTDYPNCSIETIEKVYGQPTASIVTSGTVSKPNEVILFYDDGMNASDAAATTPSTTPIDISELPNTECPAEQTIMNIVAHEDDDLLFTSPDLLDTIDAGYCVRSVYLTAGDAGQQQYYWLGRQEGSEAAYAQMANIPKEEWVQRTIKVNDTAYFTVSNHPKNKKLSLVFMQLPDGGLNGSGFAAYNNNSLYHMLNTTGTIKSVNGESTYTTASLEATLVTLMQKYNPTHIRTLSTYDGKNWPDHNDHHQANIITHQVFAKYIAANNIDPANIQITNYMGYPVRLYPVNVTGDPFNKKMAAFLQYAQLDNAVCHSAIECANTPTYFGYLQRQYPYPQ